MPWYCHTAQTSRKYPNNHTTNVTNTRQLTTILENKEKHTYVQVWKVNTQHVQVTIYKFIYKVYTTYTLITKLKTTELSEYRNNKTNPRQRRHFVVDACITGKQKVKN